MASAATTTANGSLLLPRRSGSSSIRRRASSISCTAVAPPPPAAISSERVFNFAAGPANLPLKVLLKAQEELVNYRGSGMSIMEMSHRGKEFDGVIKKAESDLRRLLSISDDYAVLFLQGGATSLFSAVPLNLCPSSSDVADYIVTGSWSDKAFKEAAKYCKPQQIWTGKPNKYTSIPPLNQIQQSENAKYLHICANETIHGVEFKDYPAPAGEGVLVADMSSNFCSKPVDVSRFGLIYAGAQKNVGPSGVTIAIARRDLIDGRAQPITPVMMDLRVQAEARSLYNTPPCVAIYVCGLVFEDLIEQGGLAEVEKRNALKAGVLYQAINGSGGYYVCPVEEPVRSAMNVPFTLAKGAELEKRFLEEAAAEGMVQLKGHRSVGGVRASIYNAMPLAGVQKLASFMKDFQARNP